MERWCAAVGSWCTIRLATLWRPRTTRNTAPTNDWPQRARRKNGGRRRDMATDYDAPRKNEEDKSEESLEELKARRHDKNSGKGDENKAEAAKPFELPGAALPHGEPAGEGGPRQADESTCMGGFP